MEIVELSAYNVDLSINKIHNTSISYIVAIASTFTVVIAWCVSIFFLFRFGKN